MLFLESVLDYEIKRVKCQFLCSFMKCVDYHLLVHVCLINLCWHIVGSHPWYVLLITQNLWLGEGLTASGVVAVAVACSLFG